MDFRVPPTKVLELGCGVCGLFFPKPSAVGDLDGTADPCNYASIVCIPGSRAPPSFFLSLRVISLAGALGYRRCKGMARL